MKCESKMRRTVGVFLILLFWLGPLAAVLPAGTESRLPACCRRLGAHHCVMSAAMASLPPPGSTPVFAPSSHCPAFPGTPAASTIPVHALAASSASMPALFAQPHAPAASRAVARLSQLRTRANRGPPASYIA
jgi:hypothetical protein